MKKHVYLLALLISFVFVACDDSEDPSASTTTLTVTVKNTSGTVQSGATVIVYNSEENWLDSTNPHSTKSTSSDGKAVFSLPGDKKYWLDAEKGSLFGYTAISNTLSSGSEYEITVTID